MENYAETDHWSYKTWYKPNTVIKILTIEVEDSDKNEE